MSHIHVCLVSEQPIPTITTVLQLKPDTIVLLKTKEMEEKAKLLENVLQKDGYDVISEPIMAYDINDVIKKSEALINKCRNCEVSLNITGGTKIGTLGTFQAFYTRNKTIYYVNTKDNEILKLFPENAQKKLPITVSIPAKDYLAAHGFIINSYVKDDGYIFRRKALTNYLANKPEIIGKMNFQLHKFDDKSLLPITVDFTRDRKFYELVGLLDSTRITKGKVQINDYADLKYLKGFWFEEYVYMVAKSLATDEVRLNVVGKWVTKGKHPPKNEFDVLMAKGTRLFYISCKTANPNRKSSDIEEESIGKEYLYELDSIGDNALGLFGKRMLASARKVEDPNVRERARMLRIDIVDGKDIITLKDRLTQWLMK